MRTMAAAALLWLAGAAAGAYAAPNPELAKIVADYDAFALANDPIGAGLEGDKDALARLPDITPAHRAAELAALKVFDQRLHALDGAALDDGDALNRDFLERIVGEGIAFAPFDEDRIPFQADSGFHTAMGFLAGITTVKTRADADAYVKRLEAGPGFLDQSVANMRRGVSSGFMASKPTVQLVIDTLKRQDSAKLMEPLKDQPADVKARAQVAADKIAAANKRALTFMEAVYLPKAPALRGARGQPNGAAYYRALIRRETTTEMEPDQIHQLGLSEVARIRGRMDEVIKQTGFKGTFPEFLAFLRTDPQFYAKTPEELMMRASELAKRSDGKLPSLFGRLPQLPYTVEPVPADIAPAYTSARYNGGSMKAGIPGKFWVNTYMLDQRPLYELPSLTLHEAVPGHHLQIALGQEMGEQPYFRRNAGVTAFVEGWGLYSEYLGEETGFYRTPYEMFGRLSMEMWRACRLVADTGIHWKGWTIEEARKCFTDNTALAPHNIETELQRYLSWPGQALGYKIGEIEIRRLRKKAEDALGDKFNIRRFHDALLGAGALPLDLLDKRIDAWIAAGG